jgi:methylphosphotriester-DNA--protein-cysteine methyltransferase
LRANEARYIKNKYDHVFTVEPASNARTTIDWVHRLLKKTDQSHLTRAFKAAFGLTPGRYRLLTSRVGGAS